MTTNSTPRVVTAIAVAVGIFLAAVVLPKLVLSAPVPRLAVGQGLELILALLAIAILGKARFADYGFCRPRVDPASPQGNVRWHWVIVGALLMGIIASGVILGLGGNGNPVVKSLTFPQIILFVWISSSTIEEIFTRGFLQGHLSDLSGRYVKLLGFRIEIPVLISALFFACMHLSLLFIGADATTVVVVWLFTFSIGLMAGHVRARTSSLLPAIGVHMLANIGGMLGGVIYAITYFLITGKLVGA